MLVGDHKQLRPSNEVYALARDYNLDVSLFERLVRNRGQCETLGVQHRMAPEMATLLVPAIYPRLENHPSMSLQPQVPGLPKRLYFVNQDHPEQHVSRVQYLLSYFYFMKIENLILIFFVCVCEDKNYYLPLTLKINKIK